MVQVRQDLFLANDVEKEIKNKSRLKGFITPCYDRYSIANVPPTILSIFQAKAQGCERLPKNIIDEHSDGVHKIVLLIVDSMGYKQFFNRYPKDPALKIVTDNSNLIPITSTFPSTTTTALTTLSTGVTPREHGIIGYTMYLKGYGFVANMIDFAPAYDYKWGTLLEMGLNPKDFLGLKTIYGILNEEGIKTHAVVRFKDSGLSKMNLNDAKISTYVNSSDLFVTLRRLLEDEDDEEAYFCAYWDLMDTISHVYGPYSEEVLAELRSFFHSYKTEFLDRLKRDVAKETLLMVTADHGQSEASKENAIFASDHPELMNRLWIPPTGDSRAVFLYAKPGEIDEVKDYVNAKLRDRLFILDSDKAIEEGLFGVGLDKKMIKERVGDLIMLPYSNNSFAYRHRGLEKDFTMKGAHGGMSKDEMLVPFICKKLKP